MKFRIAGKAKDYDKIWEIFSKVIATEDTYVFDPNTPKEFLSELWFADSMDTFVGVEMRRIL